MIDHDCVFHFSPAGRASMGVSKTSVCDLGEIQKIEKTLEPKRVGQLIGSKQNLSKYDAKGF